MKKSYKIRVRNEQYKENGKVARIYICVCVCVCVCGHVCIKLNRDIANIRIANAKITNRITTITISISAVLEIRETIIQFMKHFGQTIAMRY
jgi:hypothetical protein